MSEWASRVEARDWTHGHVDEQEEHEGEATKCCCVKLEENRWCMPFSGSHTLIAPKVSPW